MNIADPATEDQEVKEEQDDEVTILFQNSEEITAYRIEGEEVCDEDVTDLNMSTTKLDVSATDPNAAPDNLDMSVNSAMSTNSDS